MESLIVDGKKYKIEENEQAYQTSRTFTGSWHGAAKGEEYEDEWELNAIDEDGEDCKLVYHFTVTKGNEPEEADNLDWDNHNNIVDIKY